ncbi:MAG: GntR family transcriptional regulator [Rhodoplanes sp.]|uniref:GntR family transcriptional regulator n=1 Tax=Rhodoplanes sp. TaxID=1968906 RepID=UPI0017D2BFF7|nr:GntR family transcriptional regulator [Rhodoplanes sp.]NVO12416.1 GntR family transcriptional regulator [Rhodoplanes sp.]
MNQTVLTHQLAARITDIIRTANVPKGMRLVERKLAEQLRVSRSPVRNALRLLEAEGVVGGADGGGYVVLDPQLASEPRATPTPSDEETYYRIARDRLDGTLPERVTENALVRRYRLTRVQLTKILRRIAGEGWIARLPGHGWEFLPVLTSMQAYEDSYRFRQTIEPAAILEPGFVLDRDALVACRAEQQRLLDGDIWTVSNATLFDLNSRLHEAIVTCSRNTFFIDALKRVDTLRRLIEYKQSLDRKNAVVRCREHVVLVDLLLANNREEASALMRRHLDSVGREKVLPKPDR